MAQKSVNKEGMTFRNNMTLGPVHGPVREREMADGSFSDSPFIAERKGVSERREQSRASA